MRTYNPLALLSLPLLEAMIKNGITYFVRQRFPDGLRYFPSEELVGCYILTHYIDKGKALEHMQAINADPGKRLYTVTEDQDLADLKKASSQPGGYKILTTLLNTKKWEPPRGFEESLRKYLRHSGYWPKRTDELTAGPFFEFGVLFLKVKWAGNEIRVPFTNVQK